MKSAQITRPDRRGSKWRRFGTLFDKVMMGCSITLLLLTVGGFLTLWAMASLDRPPDPKTTRGKDELQGITQTARPLIAALDRYHQDKGAYPQKLEALHPAYLPTAPDEQEEGLWNHWRYSHGEGSKFALVYVFDRDNRISYTHDPKTGDRWEYNNDDEGSATVLNFH
jgi:hypothetical protein